MGIYIIQAGDGGPIKIGFTNVDPHGRFHTIQSHNVTKLVLLAVFDGDRQREKELHHRFAKSHLHGEWFSPDDALLKFIAKMPKPPEPKGRQKWNTLTEKQVARAKRIWFNKSIPTDAEAARQIGRHMVTIKTNLGKSGRTWRLTRSAAKEIGRKGGEASAKTDQRKPFAEVQAIIDANPTLTYSELAEKINEDATYKKPWHVSTLMYWRKKRRIKLARRNAGRQPRAPH
jgi:hypothetical protein